MPFNLFYQPKSSDSVSCAPRLSFSAMASLIDAIFLAVHDVAKSTAFYKKVLLPMGITYVFDYEGKNAPFDHPRLHGFGRDGRVFFWLRQGTPGSTHVGFAAKSEAEVNACYEAAISDGATPNDSMGGAPGARTWVSTINLLLRSPVCQVWQSSRMHVEGD